MEDFLNEKLNKVFSGRVVRKDLTQKIKEGANVPVYVLEYLLGMYAATDDEDSIEEGVKRVKDILSSNFVRPDEAEKIKEYLEEHSEVSYDVVEFQEEHEALAIKGGMIEGQLFEPDQVEEIADLPSRRELLTRVAMGINSPLQNLVRFLKNPLQKLTDVLNQVKEQKEE